MRFAFTDEQVALREAVRGALTRELPLGRVRTCLDALDFAPARDLAARQGWTGIGVAEDLGGQGGGTVERAILAEELARAAAPGSTLLTGALAADLLAAADRTPDGDALLARLAEGDATAAIAMRADTTTETGVDVAGGAATGVVPHVLGAPEVDVLLVLEEDGGVFSVARDARGVHLRRRELLDLGRTIADVRLVDAEAAPVGRVAAGTDAVRPSGAVLVAADALGSAGALLAMTVAYVADREQFDVPVGSFQAVKHAAADMLVDVETSLSAVFYAAWALDAGDAAAPIAVAVAKSFATTAAARVADRALALHGAVGFTWEHDLHLFLRRARTALVLFGSPAAHDAALADALDLAPLAAAAA